MNMDGSIRVKTDRKYRSIYNELKNFAFGDMHELFFLCVCLGYTANKKKPLGKDGDDRFWSRTITPEEWTCYYAIMVKVSNMDFNCIGNDKEVIACMEQYANAGMEFLLQEFLSDYLTGGPDEPKLDINAAKELPKIFLSFIFQRINEIS